MIAGRACVVDFSVQLTNFPDTTVVMAKSRSTNWSQEEANVILNEYANNKHILESAFTNAITHEVKRNIWSEIATKVNAIGVAVRTGEQCKHKWKGMKMEAKKEFNIRRKDVNKTGGGPPPKELKSSVLRTIDLMKDQASFKGVEGGVDTFDASASDADRANSLLELSRLAEIEGMGNESEENEQFSPSLCPNSSLRNESFRTLDTSEIGITLSPPRQQQFPAATNDISGSISTESATSVHPHPRPARAPAPVPLPKDTSKKRKHYSTVPDRQVKVLQGEEHVQKLKIDNLQLMKSKLLIEVDVANLQRQKLRMEMAVIKKRNPDIFGDMEDGDDPFGKPSGTLTFEDVL